MNSHAPRTVGIAQSREAWTELSLRRGGSYRCSTCTMRMATEQTARSTPTVQDIAPSPPFLCGCYSPTAVRILPLQHSADRMITSALLWPRDWLSRTTPKSRLRRFAPAQGPLPSERNCHGPLRLDTTKKKVFRPEVRGAPWGYRTSAENARS